MRTKIQIDRPAALANELKTISPNSFIETTAQQDKVTQSFQEYIESEFLKHFDNRKNSNQQQLNRQKDFSNGK